MDQEGIIAVYLFGSAVRQSSNRINDVDVAILYEKDNIPDYFSVLDQQEHLASFLKKDVDTVVLNKAPVMLRMQVFKKGRPVLIKDRKTLNRFIVSTMNEYFDLKMVRRPIEQALHRVTIYG